MNEEPAAGGTLHDAHAVTRIAHRLKRARGQLTAVIAAVEDGGDCRDVVTQLAAVSSALDRAGFAVISTAMRQCLVEEGFDDDPPAADGTDPAPRRLTVAELEKLFLTLA